jgi:hypothetical protein
MRRAQQITRTLWSDVETMSPVGGVLMTDEVALDNEMEQQLLDSFGFERDIAISDVPVMVMSKDILKRLYGEANNLLHLSAKSWLR